MARLFFLRAIIAIFTLNFITMSKQSTLKDFILQKRPETPMERESEAVTPSPSASTSTGISNADQQQQQHVNTVKESKRTFQRSWAATRAWLSHDTSRNLMFCELCRKYDKKKKSNFVDGCSLLKLDSVVKHEQTEVHKSAVLASKAEKLSKSSSTPILMGLQKMSEEELNILQKQFRTAFFVAKKDRPFSDFEDLCKLQSENFKCNLTKYYCSDKQCRTFISFIAGNYMQTINESVAQTDFFSIICDGSTDSAVLEEELYYVKYLDEGFEPTVKFVSFEAVEKADAEGLVKACKNALENKLNLNNWQNGLVVVCCDGASVNLGVNKGFVTRLTETVPHLLGLHCTAHRLELAIKDCVKSIPYMDTVDEFLQTLYTTYHNSALMWSGLRETAKAFDMKALKPVCVWGTRWVAHRERAVNVILKQYNILATHLHQVSINDSSEKAAKCKGLHKTLTSLRFVLFISALQVFLSTCANLSEVLQKNTTDLEKLYVKLATTQTQLLNYESEKNINEFVNTQLENGTAYRGIKLDLTNTRRSDKNEEPKRVIKDVEKLFSGAAKCISERFETVKDKKFRNFKVFCPKQWPSEDKHLSEFGKEEIKSLVSMYRACLVSKGYDPAGVLSEWSALLTELCIENSSQKLQSSNSLTFWPKILRDTDKAVEYRNVLALVKIMLVIPVSSSEAERGFSWMGRVKSDFRSRMGSLVMRDLMTIHMCEDSLETFDPKPSVLSWWKTGRKKRRFVCKYGPHAKASKTDTQAAISLQDQSDTDLSSESD